MIRIKISVATTLAMIAPTKNPSSRLKTTPQAVQEVLTLNGRAKIAARPQAGHRSFRHLARMRKIARGFLFIDRIQTWPGGRCSGEEKVYPPARVKWNVLSSYLSCSQQ